MLCIFFTHPLFLSDFNQTRIIFSGFSKKILAPNFMKILSVGAELFHADGWTEMTKPRVAFCNVANMLKNLLYRVRINYRWILQKHIFTNTEQKYMMLLPFERGMFAVS